MKCAHFRRSPEQRLTLHHILQAILTTTKHWLCIPTHTLLYIQNLPLIWFWSQVKFDVTILKTKVLSSICELFPQFSKRWNLLFSVISYTGTDVVACKYWAMSLQCLLTCRGPLTRHVHFVVASLCQRSVIRDATFQMPARKRARLLQYPCHCLNSFKISEQESRTYEDRTLKRPLK